MRTVLTVVLLALTLAACGRGLASGPATTPSSVPSDPTLPPNVVALAPAQLARSEYAAEADRTPSTAEIRAVIPIVRHRFGMIELSPSLKPFGAYHLQFAGLRGDRIAVNALCSVDRMNWRSGWITVNDGGDCFWHAVVRDGRIETFSVNGSA